MWGHGRVACLLAAVFWLETLGPGSCFVTISAPRAAVLLGARGRLSGAPYQQPAARPRPAGQRAVVRAMFSGIVEEMGTVRSLEKRGDVELWDGSVGEGVELTVDASAVLEGASLGCSIAVNGVCLTATELDERGFRVGLAPETLRKSNLEALEAGDPVNLERALAADGRNSGHFVQGHVDDVGTIESMTPEGDSLWVRVRVPRELLRYIVPKGFVAVDGTSLTVCEVDAEPEDGGLPAFTFMLVAYTQQHIVLPKKAPGDKVNIEVDVLAKYVERSMGSIAGRLESLEYNSRTRLAELEERAVSLEGKLGRLKNMPTASKITEVMGSMEQKIRSRDLVIDRLEARLAMLERGR